MAVKPESLAQYIGIDLSKVESEDELREAFDKEFVRRSSAAEDPQVAAKIFGKVNALMRQRIKAFAKSMGVDLGNVEEKDPSALIVELNEGVTAIHQSLTSEVEKLKTSNAKGSNDEAIKALEDKLQKLEKERDAFGTNAKEWESKYRDLETSVKEREVKTKRETLINEALKAVPFAEGVNEFTRKGFIADFLDRYDLDLGDDGYKVIDKSTKSPIMDKKRAQTFAQLPDLMKEAAEAAKLTQAPNAGQPVRKTIATLSAGGGQAPAPQSHLGERRTRPVMPPVP